MILISALLILGAFNGRGSSLAAQSPSRTERAALQPERHREAQHPVDRLEKETGSCSLRSPHAF